MLQNRPHSDRAPPPPYLFPLARALHAHRCPRQTRIEARAPRFASASGPRCARPARRRTAHLRNVALMLGCRRYLRYGAARSGTCRGGGGAFTCVANGARHSRCARGRGWRAPRAAGGLFLLGRVFCDFSIVKKYAVRRRAGRAHRGPDALANRGARASIRVWRGRRWACNARARGRR